jgi:5-formyltetrahydrofolate cyclo-ligase
MDKQAIREKALAKRKTIKDIEQIEMTEAYLKRLANHEIFVEAKTVGLYYPIQEEMNLLSMIEQYPNKSFYMPNIEDNHIVYRKINDVSELHQAKFGLKEVKQDAEAISDCDLFIIPCVATAGLLRIGYGKGYFDQYLKDKKGYKLGITYPCLKFETIEKAPHDILLDEVL